MRPALFALLLNPLIRYPSQSLALARRIIPPLEYPACRTLSSNSGQQHYSNSHHAMADSRPGEAEQSERVAVPCEGSSKSGGGVDPAGEASEPAEAPLPKLSAAEFRAYNSMATNMEYYHNHFRQSWTLLHSACVNNQRPAGMSLKQFISTGLQLCSHLEMHHSIEEAHIFPLLARKMPEFRAGRNAAELLRQHKEIHKGMDGLVEYLNRCRSGETELELRVLKQQLDTWGDVLWKHLDQEVKTLGAENMRKYWTLEEMRRMPM